MDLQLLELTGSSRAFRSCRPMDDQFIHRAHAVRIALTIFILIVLGLACIDNCLVALSFTVNRAYIAKNICEQRSIPGNACQGCCYMRKLQKNEDQKEQAPPAREMNESLSLVAVAAPPQCVVSAPPSGAVFFPAECTPLPLPPGQDIDHPPEYFSA